ncbi:hypothetical protein Tco_1530261 [Tanacetum coccineum]
MATNEETYDQPLAMTTTNMFQANHEDAYDSDVDEGPNAAAAFMANLSSTMPFQHQKELSGDQVYWLSAKEIASQASKPTTPATPFVHKSRPPSQVLASLQQVNANFSQQFEVEPIVEPLELTPSVSSSSKVTKISRFPDCKLSDRKAGSKGISGIFEC